MLMELQKQRKKARREEKQYDRAIDRILHLQQKDYESPNTDGTRASKPLAMVDEDDERWVVKQFINGIERKEFRRSLRVDWKSDKKMTLDAAISMLEALYKMADHGDYDSDSGGDHKPVTYVSYPFHTPTHALVTTDRGGPTMGPGARMRQLCPFLYEMLSDSEIDSTETAPIKVEPSTPPREYSNEQTEAGTDVQYPVMEAGMRGESFAHSSMKLCRIRSANCHLQHR